jgi:hypothetical protein
MKSIVILFLIIGLVWSLKPDQKAEDFIQQMWDEVHQIIENKKSDREKMTTEWVKKWHTDNVAVQFQDNILNGVDEYVKFNLVWMNWFTSFSHKVIKTIAVETQTWDYHAFVITSEVWKNGCVHSLQKQMSLKLENNKVSKMLLEWRMDDLIQQCTGDGYAVPELLNSGTA